MPKILTPLVMEKVEGTDDLWKVVEEYRYQSDVVGLVIVPVGFVSDFASVPRIFWDVFPKDGRYDDAAVVHDYLYSTKTFSRDKCDATFLECMKLLDVNWWTRSTMYNAVRLFGWMFWK